MRGAKRRGNPRGHAEPSVLPRFARKDELITPKDQLGKTHVLRRILAPMGAQDAIEFLMDKLRQSKNNGDFFQSMNT